MVADRKLALGISEYEMLMDEHSATRRAVQETFTQGFNPLKAPGLAKRYADIMHYHLKEATGVYQHDTYMANMYAERIDELESALLNADSLGNWEPLSILLHQEAQRLTYHDGLAISFMATSLVMEKPLYQP